MMSAGRRLLYCDQISGRLLGGLVLVRANTIGGGTVELLWSGDVIMSVSGSGLSWLWLGVGSTPALRAVLQLENFAT